MKKITTILLSAASAGLIVACGAGAESNGTAYYSASNTSHYVIESGINPQNESQLYITIVKQSGYFLQVPLESTTVVNNYTYAQGNTSGTVTLNSSGNLGISYTSNGNSWIDFASIESHIASNIPNGTYNLICDQASLSPCIMEIGSYSNGSQFVSVTEYSISGAATPLCSSSIIPTGQSNPINPYLYSFQCKNSGGSGTWDLLPFTQNGETALMVAENNYATNITDDSTDEIAFPVKSINPINPNGTYNYLYNGGPISGGVGVISNAQFISGSVLTNNIVGCIPCSLNQNAYYNYAAVGFDWYNNQSLGFYNLTGNDAMKIYQDSFVGFYF